MPLKTLENCTVFTIDGYDLYPLRFRLSQYNTARHDQRLLVGQRDCLSRLNRLQSGDETGRSDHRGYDQIRPGGCRYLPVAFRPEEHSRRRVGIQEAPQFERVLLIDYRCQARPETFDLTFQEPEIATGGQGL